LIVTSLVTEFSVFRNLGLHKYLTLAWACSHLHTVLS
jgi:hypothetical protein